MFASHFNSIYSFAHCATDMKSLNMLFLNLPNNAYFSVDDVLFKLFALRGVVSVGLDGIPEDFFYQLRQVISFPLCLLS